jgi:hypothetical protein
MNNRQKEPTTLDLNVSAGTSSHRRLGKPVVLSEFGGRRVVCCRPTHDHLRPAAACFSMTRPQLYLQVRPTLGTTCFDAALLHAGVCPSMLQHGRPLHGNQPLRFH